MIPYTCIILPLKVRLALKLLNFIHLDKDIFFFRRTKCQKSQIYGRIYFLLEAEYFWTLWLEKSCQALAIIGRREGGGPGEDARGGVEPYGMLTSPLPPPSPSHPLFLKKLYCDEKFFIFAPMIHARKLLRRPDASVTNVFFLIGRT